MIFNIEIEKLRLSDTFRVWAVCGCSDQFGLDIGKSIASPMDRP